MIIIFWFCSNNLTQYQFKRELLAWGICKVALIKVQNNSLTVASVSHMFGGGCCFILRKDNPALCHLIVVQNTFLFSFNWTNQTQGTARFESVIHTNNKTHLMQSEVRNSCASALLVEGLLSVSWVHKSFAVTVFFDLKTVEW